MQQTITQGFAYGDEARSSQRRITACAGAPDWAARAGGKSEIAEQVPLQDLRDRDGFVVVTRHAYSANDRSERAHRFAVRPSLFPGAMPREVELAPSILVGLVDDDVDVVRYCHV